MTSIRNSALAAAFLMAASAVAVAQGTGNGLHVEYYHLGSNNFIEARANQGPIDNNYAAAGPGAPVPNDNYFARYRGQVEGPAPANGLIRFQLQSDDGARVVFNGTQVLNHTGTATSNTGDIAVTAGQLYTLVVEHTEFTGNSLIHLRWNWDPTDPTDRVNYVPVPLNMLYSPAVPDPAPGINVNGGETPQSITLTTGVVGADIYYTLDGSDPGFFTPAATAKRFVAPFTVDTYSRVKARAFVTGNPMPSTLLVSNQFSPRYAVLSPTPTTQAGLYRRLYHHNGVGTIAMPNWEAQTPEWRTNELFQLNGTSGIQDRNGRNDNFAMVYNGYLNIPVGGAGMWTFDLNSDDDSQLIIQGVLVTQSLTTGTAFAGQIALEEGLHPFTVNYYDGTGGESLTLRWQGPTVPALVAIPAAAFSTDLIAPVVTSTFTAATGQVQLNTTLGATILYTTDGSAPDERAAQGSGTSGLTFTISQSTRVRALAVLPNRHPGPILDTTLVPTTVNGAVLHSVVSAGVDTRVDVNFDRTVTNPSASVSGNYTLNGGGTVSAAALQPRNADLKLWLKLDETAGPTANDSSPIGGTGAVDGTNDGTNDGVWGNTPVSSTANLAPVQPSNPRNMQFQNADQDHVEVAHHSSLDFGLGSFTIAFWVRPNDTTADRFLSKFDATSGRGWLIMTQSTTGAADDSGNLRFHMFDGTNTAFNQAPDIGLSTAAIQHVAVRFDRVTNRVHYFRDGVLRATQDVGTITNIDTTRPVLLGRLENNDGTNNGNPFAGWADDVRIYGVALSDAEVLGLFRGAMDPSTRVVLTTSALTNPSYTLSVNGVQDLTTPTPLTTADAMTFSYRTGTLSQEFYPGISAADDILSFVRNANFPNNPGALGAPTTALIAPAEMGQTNPNQEQFGTRVRGYFLAPAAPAGTQNWRFAIAGDNHCQLWLSTDEDPARRVLISRVQTSAGGNGWAPNGGYDDVDVIQSGVIALQAGQRYYLEALVRENNGGDNYSIAAKLDDGTPIANGAASIPAAQIAPYVEQVRFAVQPVGRVVRAGQNITLTATVFGSARSLQWKRNGANVAEANAAGATTQTLTITNADSNNTGTYTLEATGTTGLLPSTTVIVTVVTPALPTITNITPVFGPAHGGQVVRLNGTNLMFGTAALTLGGSATVNPVWSVDGSYMYAMTPARAVGAVDVVATTYIAAASATLTNGYTYYDVPTITSVLPAAGDADGGTSVTIQGTSFMAGTQVFFDGVPATGETPSGDGQSLVCVAPAHAVGGPFAVTVTNAYGSVIQANAFTYYADPTIGTINPPHGPDNGGPPAGFLNIAITGSNFVQGATTVTFGAVGTVPGTVNLMGDSLTCVPPGPTAAGPVNVVVNTPGGSTTSLVYTYYADPTLSPLTTTGGADQGGSTITLNGTNFVNNFTTVFFGATQGTVVSVAPDGLSLQVTTPPGSNTVDVTVNTPGGSAVRPAAFTYFQDPTISTVVNQNTLAYVNNGRSLGGNNVRITGANFAGNPVTVTFDGVTATGISVTGTNQIDCVSPAGAAGARQITVGTYGGSVNATWIYHDAPTVATVTPSNTGGTQGGDNRTINGTNLPNGLTAVTFGGQPATNVNASGGSATLTTPAHASGTVDVVATTPGGSGTLTNGYTYTGPFFNSVNPPVGPEGGGQDVTLDGSGLAGATFVRFGGVDGVIGTNTANQIVVTTPPGTGTVDVTVITPSGTYTMSGSYTYTGTPTILNINPNQGPLTNNAAITITGTNFADTFTTVTFGGVAGTVNSVTGTTSLNVTPPNAPGGTPGNVPVVVTTYGIANSLPGTFTYVGAPTVATITPNRGPIGGGRTVTITGTNFVSGAGLTDVTIGGVAATTVNVLSPTSLTCVTGPHAAGQVDVVVRNFNPPGQAGTLTNGYTYVDPATSLDLELANSVDNPFPSVGQNVTFTIDLDNLGGAAGTGVTVSAPLPAGLSLVTATPSVGTYTAATGVWNIGNIAATNGNAVLTLLVTVNSSALQTLTAEVTAGNPADVDSTPGNTLAGEDDIATATVQAALSILTGGTLPAGTARAYYATTLSAAGGVPPYSWSLVTSTPAFPFNLDSATGEISGFAPNVGAQTTYNFTVQVSDSSSTAQTTSAPFSITINLPNAGPPVVANTPAAPNGVVGQAYSHTFTATGGAPPYTWTSTALPAGLALNAFTGELAGTPSTPGAASFSVTATPATGAASAALPVSFTISTNPVTITPGTLPNGTIGAQYTHYVEVTGGIGPFTWTVSAGTMPAWMTPPTTGRRIVLTGTPNTTVNPGFTLQVTDGGQVGVTDTQAYTFTIGASAAGTPVTITTPPSGFPVATQGVGYSVRLSGAGGGPPYFWTLISGALPPGLSLDQASGLISGNPSAPGIYGFTVSAVEFGGVTPATASVTITVAAPPSAPASLALPAAVQNSGYFAQLTVAGGASPITWSGPVPAGLSLNAQTGTLSGIPAGTGAQTINVTATDANGAAVNLSFSLNIAPASATLAVISNSIPRGQVGVPYSGSLFAIGGTDPYTWTLLTPAALPAGLSLDASTGTISGTPTAVGSTAMTFQVTDAVLATAASGTITLDVDGVLTITTSSLPLAGVSSGYGAGLSATGGVGTLTWSLVSGSLPAGLGLSPAGTIGGTCSATAVTSSFQVRVTDSLGRTANRSFTITVGPQIFPPGGGGGGGGGGCGGSIGLGSIPLGALASLAALLALAARRRKT